MTSGDSAEKENASHPTQRTETPSVNNNNGCGGEINHSFVSDEKRVSIASDALQADIERQRTLSAGSHDSRYKSILVNGSDRLRHTLGELKYFLPVVEIPL